MEPAITEQLEPLLEDYMDDAALAAELKVSERTIKRWRAMRLGPPVTYIGRQPYYHRKSVRRWLVEQERESVRAGAR